MDAAVYQLKPVLDDPMFEGLLFGDRVRSVLGNAIPSDDLEPVQDVSGEWNVPVLSHLWKAKVEVKGAVRPFNDYPGIEMMFPAFSPRAVDALGKMLTANGELLPVQHKHGTYYVYNLRHLSNALKASACKFERMSSGNVVRIVWYDFVRNRLRKETIFRLPARPYEVHCTEAFRQRVIECGLNGFHFIKVWPLPNEVDWRDLETKARKKRSKDHVLRGETLILRFRCEGTKPSAAEARRRKRYTEELTDLLSSQLSASDAYFGSMEASETIGGEIRIFLSGPSTDKLEAYLAPWIRDCDWPGEFHIVKRWGHVMDREAKEKRVVIR